MKSEYDFSEAMPLHVSAKTPIHFIDGVWYKRDDLYCPFGNDVNGGKVRQAICLLYSKRKMIRERYSGVITHTQVHSTTGAIIARVCKELGIKCVICIGGSSQETLENHHMMKYAKYLGADIRNVCGTGMHGPVLSRMREIATKENLFDAVFSHNVTDSPFSVMDCISRQVENLPSELDQLVVPVGSAIHFSAILHGLHRYDKQVKTIYGLCVGPTREKSVDQWIDPFDTPRREYKMICLNTVYGKPLVEKIGNGILLDELYEAKAHKWMRENLDLNKNNTGFWIVGRRLSPVEIETTIGTDNGNATST